MWKELGIIGGTAIIVLAALYFVIKWAVKSGMKEAYEEIYLKLGNECTDSQIAKEYISNKSYYDSIKWRLLSNLICWYGKEDGWLSERSKKPTVEDKLLMEEYSRGVYQGD